MNSLSIKTLIVFGFLLVAISGLSSGRHAKSIADMSDEDTEGSSSHRYISSTATPLGFQSGAILKKNRVKGPADIGIYYVNSPAASCGGFSTSVCSKNCGALGYPVYWCYPKVCYCHYGAKDGEETPELPN